MTTKRARERLEYTPTWEGPVKQWATNFLRKNKWRCDPVHELDDLLQDAHIVFLKIKDRYPSVCAPQHFMALYKRALSNSIHDHARYMRRKRELHVETALDVSEAYADTIGEHANGGYLAALLNTAPEEVRDAIIVLATSQDEPKVKRRGLQPRENRNMKLRRVLGFDKMAEEYRTYDFSSAIKALVG